MMILEEIFKMAWFKKKEENNETPPMENVVSNSSSIQREYNLKKHLKIVNKDLDAINSQIDDLQEKKTAKLNIIALSQKDIADHDREIERLTSKKRVLDEKKHEVEHELQFYHEGTNRDEINIQDLNRTKASDLIKVVKELPELKEQLKKLNEELSSKDKYIEELEAKINKKYEKMEETKLVSIQNEENTTKSSKKLINNKAESKVKEQKKTTQKKESKKKKNGIKKNK